MFNTSRLLNERTLLMEKVREAFTSVFPISLTVLLLTCTVVPVDNGLLLSFLFGSAAVIFGMGLFTLGADIAMTPIGNYVGENTIRTRKLSVILPVFFVLGVLITVSEPDLSVLADQLSAAVNRWILIIAVGVGVGIFLVISFLRIVFRVRLKYLLIGFYSLLFLLAAFVPKAFLPLAFDAGGVTTGPMSVPFIMAIGAGISMTRSDRGAADDSFGLTALCSIGPIFAVMILGMIYRPESVNVSAAAPVIAENSQGTVLSFLKAIPVSLGEVGIALLPILAFFLVFQLLGTRLHRHQNVRIAIGSVETYLGLVLFLTGVNVGFLPVGTYLGEQIGLLPYRWIAVPLGMLLGFFVVAAEPAVHVLTKQVYEMTAGGISKRSLSISLMAGVAVSVGLSMLRILCRIPILYFLIPCYLLSLALTFFVPDIFTAVAFDSGGVASGAMTSGFVLPFALGICRSVGGDPAADGFGVVAMVAMTPLVAIQILGLVYAIHQKKTAVPAPEETQTEEIIEEPETEEIIG